MNQKFKVERDMAEHLARQAAFSRATFGPGSREKGVSDHIRKELEEVESAPTLSAKVSEWTDVSILGLDGLLRAAREHLEARWMKRFVVGYVDKPVLTPKQVARMNEMITWDVVASYAVNCIIAKQGKNELRDWPDWRTADPDKAIEHVRTCDTA
jgi:hypothetical protein